MKRLFVSICALSLAVFSLSACAEEAPASSQSTAVSSVSVASAGSSSTAASAVDGMLATLSEPAGLGDSITLSEIDLQANGLDTSNVLAFAGAESRLSSENGGIVMVFQVTAGTESAMVTALEAYRDLRVSDDRYAEFAAARDNTANARIGSVGEYVYYAVSASGNYDALDTAIAGLSA